MRRISPTSRSVSVRAGFTLLEVMVVMAIMGIMLAAAVNYLPNDSQVYMLRQEAARMRSVLQLAADSAAEDGHEYGLFIEPNRYRFALFNATNGLWEDSNDPLLKPYSVPDNLRIHVDAKLLVLPAEKYRAQMTRPALLLLSSGQTSSYVMTLQAGDNKEMSISIKDASQINRAEERHD